MKKWWQKPLRAINLDFSACDPASVDVKAIIDESFRGNVNTLCVSATGYFPGGAVFYQSKLAPHFPGLDGRDLLAESLEAGHVNGQKVVATIASIWGGQALFKAHPDWAQRKANGDLTARDAELTSLAFCPNSPYREYLSSLLDEICQCYAVDGFFFNEPAFQSWCNCEHCKRKFLDEYGAQLPLQADWLDPIWQAFIGWRYRQIAAWREALHKTVKSENRCVFFQGAFPLARFSRAPRRFSGLELPDPYQARFGVDWYIPLAAGADFTSDARFQDVIHFDLSRRSVGEPLWWYGLCCRYGQSLAHGRQVLALNAMAQTPFDLVDLPGAELQLSIAELLANSGSPLFTRNVLDSGNRSAWDLVYSLLAEARSIEPYLEERESIGFAALLLSETTLNCLDPMPGRPSHLDCLKGWAKALLQEQVLFDVITEVDLEKALKRYRVLVLPNAGCLSSRSKQLIREYAAMGNGLVGSFETGMFDEHGQRTPADDFSELFGVSYGENPPVFNGFGEYMITDRDNPLPAGIPEGRRIPTGGVQIVASLAGARPVANVFGSACVQDVSAIAETGSPSVFAYDQGIHGRSVYFAPPLDVRYLEFGVDTHRKLLATAVHWVGQAEAPVRVENAPLTLAVTAFYQPAKKRLIVHLVNSIQEEAIRPISEVSECQGVRLLIQTTGEVKGLEVLGDPRLPNASRWGNQLSVDLPPFRYHLELVVAYR